MRQKNLKISFLEAESSTLKQRLKDTEKTVFINKQIISALVDAAQSKDFDGCYELFQSEVHNLLDQIDRLHQDKNQLNAQVLISEQIKQEIQSKEQELVIIYEGKLQGMRESAERREYCLQNAESHINELEELLREIGKYDEFVRDKLEEMEIMEYGPDNQNRGAKRITNVVNENRQLKKDLEITKQEAENLRGLLEAMNELNTQSKNQYNN